MGSREALQPSRARRFDVIVSAADDVIPKGSDEHYLIHICLQDAYFCWKDRESFQPVLEVAREIVEHIEEGRRVLVVCYSGWNRSGLLCGLVLTLMSRGRGREKHIQLIRSARGSMALSNEMFVSAIIYPPLWRLEQ